MMVPTPFLKVCETIAASNASEDNWRQGLVVVYRSCVDPTACSTVYSMHCVGTKTERTVGICGDIEYDAVRGQGPARRRDTDPTPCLVGNLRLAIAVGQKCQFDTASRSIHAFGRLLDGRDTDLVEEEGTHQHTFAVRDENDDFAVIVYLCAGNENDFAIDARRIVGLHLVLHIGRG